MKFYMLVIRMSTMQSNTCFSLEETCKCVLLYVLLLNRSHKQLTVLSFKTNILKSKIPQKPRRGYDKRLSHINIGLLRDISYRSFKRYIRRMVLFLKLPVVVKNYKEVNNRLQKLFQCLVSEFETYISKCFKGEG